MHILAYSTYSKYVWWYSSCVVHRCTYTRLEEVVLTCSVLIAPRIEQRIMKRNDLNKARIAIQCCNIMQSQIFRVNTDGLRDDFLHVRNFVTTLKHGDG